MMIDHTQQCCLAIFDKCIDQSQRINAKERFCIEIQWSRNNENRFANEWRENSYRQ